MKKLLPILFLASGLWGQTGVISGIQIPHSSVMIDPSTSGFTSILLNATGLKEAYIFQVPKTGNLWKVGFRTGTVSCVTCPIVMQVSFQDVSTTTGDPDETVDQFRTFNVADTDDNIWVLSGIISSDGSDGGSLRAVTKGDYVAVVFEDSAFAVSDVFRISVWNTNQRGGQGVVYRDNKNVTWTKAITALPNILLLYDDGLAYYIPGVFPFSAFAAEAYNSGTSGSDERGNKFTLAAPVRVTGWYGSIQTSGTGANFSIVLYDSDGTTVLATAAYDANIFSEISNSSMTQGLFNTTVNLLANTVYYLTIKPTTTNSVSLSAATVNTAAYLDQIPGGQTVHYAVKLDGGAFTMTTTKRTILGLIVDAFSLYDTQGGAAPFIVSY